MAYRNGNYAAFYVAEPFQQNALAANATEDFLYYNMLRMWKGKDVTFPFYDSHEKTYSVRDGSSWDSTLKPRLRERLRNSKNILLILTTKTYPSKPLNEEIDYGINDQGLPIIVIYPGYTDASELLLNGALKPSIKNLWNNLPIFKNSMEKVPTLHIPLSKSIVEKSLKNEKFMLSTKREPGIFRYDK